MVTETRATIQQMGQRFAEQVREREDADRLWVSRHRDEVEVWLLTKPIEMETERAFYSAAMMLYEWFPKAHIAFHLLNPRHFQGVSEDGLLSILPENADEVSLRAA
jgi:hypothetical protein